MYKISFISKCVTKESRCENKDNVKQLYNAVWNAFSEVKK